jgi:hypothetical protein
MTATNMDEGDMSDEEIRARKRLIALCMEIAENCADLIESEQAE